MHTLIGLLVTTAAACAFARPFSPAMMPEDQSMEEQDNPVKHYIMAEMLSPKQLAYDDRAVPPPYEHELLNEEIERLRNIQAQEDSIGRKGVARWLVEDAYMEAIYDDPALTNDIFSYDLDSPEDNIEPLPPPKEMDNPELLLNEFKEEKLAKPDEPPKNKEVFALTPLEIGFFEPAEKIIVEKSGGPHEGGEAVEIPPRDTRQNPNLGRTRKLIADNVGPLRTGFTESMTDGTDVPRQLNVLESDAAESIFGLALIATVGSALAMVIAGFAFGWYTFAKKAKAAADVDYPAYGVTGPTIEISGDRKLAHSAHMYHYQHQKQQIIAMGRSGLEQRNGSVSDPESEEENEEGDYTVYECPGLATTGEMEVKNPLYSEDPTPPTPGTCEIVKPQPKN